MISLSRALACSLLLLSSCVFYVNEDRHVDDWQADRPGDQSASEPASGDELAPMRSYWMGIIKRGPGYDQEMPDEEKAALQRAHLDRIGELAHEGKIILAGPFGPQEGVEDPLVGLFLYTVATREEARALADSDPAVAAGRLRVELVPWYGVSGITYPGNPVPDAAAAPAD